MVPWEQLHLVREQVFDVSMTQCFSGGCGPLPGMLVLKEAHPVPVQEPLKWDYYYKCTWCGWETSDRERTSWCGGCAAQREFEYHARPPQVEGVPPGVVDLSHVTPELFEAFREGWQATFT